MSSSNSGVSVRQEKSFHSSSRKTYTITKGQDPEKEPLKFAARSDMRIIIGENVGSDAIRSPVILNNNGDRLDYKLRAAALRWKAKKVGLDLQKIEPYAELLEAGNLYGYSKAVEKVLDDNSEDYTEEGNQSDNSEDYTEEGNQSDNSEDYPEEGNQSDNSEKHENDEDAQVKQVLGLAENEFTDRLQNNDAEVVKIYKDFVSPQIDNAKFLDFWFQNAHQNGILSGPSVRVAMDVISPLKIEKFSNGNSVTITDTREITFSFSKVPKNELVVVITTDINVNVNQTLYVNMTLVETRKFCEVVGSDDIQLVDTKVVATITEHEAAQIDRYEMPQRYFDALELELEIGQGAYDEAIQNENYNEAYRQAFHLNKKLVAVYSTQNKVEDPKKDPICKQMENILNETKAVIGNGTITHETAAKTLGAVNAELENCITYLAGQKSESFRPVTTEDDWKEMRTEAKNQISPRKKWASHILLGVGVVLGVGFLVGLGVVTAGIGPAVIATVGAAVATVVAPSIAASAVGLIAVSAGTLGLGMKQLHIKEIETRTKPVKAVETGVDSLIKKAEAAQVPVAVIPGERVSGVLGSDNAKPRGETVLLPDNPIANLHNQQKARGAFGLFSIPKEEKTPGNGEKNEQNGGYVSPPSPTHRSRLPDLNNTLKT